MEKQENIEIKRILDILIGKKLMVAIILILFTLFGCLYSYKYVVPKYQSTATLLLIPENTTITNSDLTLNSGLISTYSNILDNPKILNQVIDSLDLNMTVEELSKNMQVKVEEDTYIIKVTITDLEPQVAMNIANEVTNVFLNEIKDIYNLNNIGVIDEAQLPENPYNVHHKRDIVMSALLGIFASITAAVLIYMFDNTVKEEKDIEKYIKIKSLGSIPINNEKQEIINRNNAKSYVAECINTIRTNILYMNSTKRAKTILVTSCMPQEGKSWTSANIAVSFAETNKKVLLIDADMRKGRVHKIFNVDNRQGLSNYLYNLTENVEQDLELGKEYIKETEIPNLHILTNGTIPPNPSELVGSNNMKELLTILKNAYDIIIVDAPPCKPVTDSVILSTIADSTIIVVSAEKTKINDLQEVSRSIQNVQGDIIGVILNKTKMKGKIYSKNYYYGHANIENSEKSEQNMAISVSSVLESAKVKTVIGLKEEIEPEKEDKVREQKVIVEPNAKTEKIDNNEQIEVLIDEQNKYFEKMADMISNINSRLNSKDEAIREEISDNNKIIADSINSKNEELLNVMKEKIDSIEIKDYEKDIERINEQIDNIKVPDYTGDIEKLKQQINSIKIPNYTAEIENLKEQISNIKVVDNTEDINKIYEHIDSIEQVDYTEQIEKIYEQLENVKAHTSKMMIETINNNNTLLESVIEQNSRQMLEGVKESIDSIEQIDYTDMIEEINKKINQNIIDIKELQTKRENKMVYNLDEDIPFEELEKTAMYVIPIPKSEEPEEDMIDNYKMI